MCNEFLNQAGSSARLLAVIRVGLASTCVLGLLAGSPSIAADSAAGFYGDARIGAAFSNTLDLQSGTTQLPDVVSVEPGTGWSFIGTIGYRLSPSVRFAVDAGYGRNSFSGVYKRSIQLLIACSVGGVFQACPPPSVSGALDEKFLIGMAHYDFLSMEPWGASVGLGVGAIDIGAKVRAKLSFGSPVTTEIINARDTVLGGAGTIEMSYDFSRFQLVAGYRYMRAAAPHLDSTAPGRSFRAERPISLHQVSTGLRVAF